MHDRLAVADYRAHANINLEVVQRARVGNCLSFRNDDGEELSQSRSAAMAERARCRIAILSVRDPGNRRDSPPTLQHRNTQRILAILHRHRCSLASCHGSVRADYSSDA